MKNKQIGKGKEITFTIIAVLLLMGMVITITGCNKSSALVGRWEEVEDGTPTGEIIEFFSDGTVISEGMQFEWKTDKDRIIFSAFGFVETGSYKVSGSKLTLTDSDGEVATYRKLKK